MTLEYMPHKHTERGFIQKISVGMGKVICIEPRPLGGGGCSSGNDTCVCKSSPQKF